MQFFGKWVWSCPLGLLFAALVTEPSCQHRWERNWYSNWTFFISCIWAGHNLYHSGLLKLVQEDFILQACLTGILLARWVQLCIQLRFIFYVCVKARAMNLAARGFPFILHSSVERPAHFHRSSLRIALGGAERTKAKNRRRNSELRTRK